MFIQIQQEEKHCDNFLRYFFKGMYKKVWKIRRMRMYKQKLIFCFCYRSTLFASHHQWKLITLIFLFMMQCKQPNKTSKCIIQEGCLGTWVYSIAWHLRREDDIASRIFICVYLSWLNKHRYKHGICHICLFVCRLYEHCKLQHSYIVKGHTWHVLNFGSFLKHFSYNGINIT